MKLCDLCDTPHDDLANQCRKCGRKRISWAPTPAEIRQGCLEIQRRWTPAQERQRRDAIEDPYELPGVMEFSYPAPCIDVRYSRRVR